MTFHEFAIKNKLIKFPQNEKFYLLNYIRAISKSGKDEKKAIENKIYEYKMRKKYFLENSLKKVKYELDKGKKFADALKIGGILTEREYYILNTSKGSIANGIDKIIETNKKSSKSMAGFMLLLLPPAITLIALLASHGQVKKVLENMLEPIVSAGGTPPPIPEYLLDNSNYIFFNVLFFSILTIAIVGFYFVKHKLTKKFLKLLPIIEEEYVMDLLKSIKTISSGGGINISNAAKALKTGEKDPVKYNILNEIVERTSKGQEKISDIFEEYGANYNTVSSLRIGEDSKDINVGLNIAIEDLEQRYERDIKFFLKAGMWGGQLSMIFIAGKPIIDIMLLLSVGQLNFKV